jgi:proline iminopeptidase
MECLREHLGIDRWLVWGISWGCALGLAYAEDSPERVSEIVIWSPTLTRPTDIDWLYRGVGAFFPEEFERFRGGLPVADRDGDLVDAYRRLLADDDPKVAEKAARRWCDWEDAVVSLEPGWRPNVRYRDPSFRMGFARLVTHYFAHAAWLEDGQLLRDAHRLSGIPGVLVQGRLDLGGPARSAWELARAWPGAELQLISNTGHTGSKKMTAALLEATDRFCP